MANTQTISALRQQLWRKELYADVAKEIYFEKLIDRSGVRSIGLRDETSPRGVIQEISDLRAQPGFRITFGLATKLSGTGVDADAELEGQEEEIATYSETLDIDQKRNAVRLKGRMDEKQAAYNMRADAKEKMTIWMAETVQQDIFYKLCGDTTTTGADFANTPDAPAATRSIWANDAGATASLTVDEVMDTKVISAARQTAQLASPKIRPIMVGGKAYYVMILHPYQSADLRKDSVWNEAQRDANIRGEQKNPIFTGALGIYEQVIIHEHEDIYTGNDGAASIPIARAILCGAQAGILAYGGPVNWVEKSFDYGNKWGISCGRIWGCVKPFFNSVDYGVVTCFTAATTASTA
jgi:N4-gp56 family major capsid protein